MKKRQKNILLNQRLHKEQILREIKGYVVFCKTAYPFFLTYIMKGKKIELDDLLEAKYVERKK